MGLVPIALGNDGGGSVRIPAAHNGVVGLKGTFGRVPTEGVPILCWSLEHVGPLAATVEDTLLAFGVITDERLVLPELPRPLRIGICDRWWQWGDGEVAGDRARGGERIVGGQIVDVDLPHIELSLPVGAATFTVEGAAAMDAALERGEPLVGGDAHRLRDGALDERGVVRAGAAGARARRARLRVGVGQRRRHRHADDGDDGAAHPRRRGGRRARRGQDQQAVTFTFAQNLSGMPAVSVPCGYDAAGMPVGMQIIAPHGEDLRALAVAAAVEHVTTRHKPKVWCSPL